MEQRMDVEESRDEFRSRHLASVSQTAGGRLYCLPPDRA
jgi:hypothetical protein